MTELYRRILDDEAEGTLEEMEEGVVIELDEDDLEEVAGGKKHTYITGTKDTKVRTGPGNHYKQIGKLHEGESWRYTHESAKDERGVTWYRVESGSKTGWVSSKYGKKEKF